MGAKKSTSQARPSTNKSRNKSGNRVSPPAAAVSDPEALLDAIEEERSRLMNAEAVLHCVLIAFDENGGRCNPDGPYLPGVIGIARDLVARTITRLDPDRLDSIVEGTSNDADADYAEMDSAVGQKLEVKEGALAYLH
jgi:hypothetical protein